MATIGLYCSRTAFMFDLGTSGPMKVDGELAEYRGPIGQKGARGSLACQRIWRPGKMGGWIKIFQYGSWSTGLMKVGEEVAGESGLYILRSWHYAHVQNGNIIICLYLLQNATGNIKFLCFFTTILIFGSPLDSWPAYHLSIYSQREHLPFNLTPFLKAYVVLIYIEVSAQDILSKIV